MPSAPCRIMLPDSSTANREVTAQFVSKRFLGRGSYGEVDEVRELSTGASYARKHIHLNTGNASGLIEQVENEVSIMPKLRHQPIATVLFHLKDDESYIIFMLPVADHDLRVFLNLCIEQDRPHSVTVCHG